MPINITNFNNLFLFLNIVKQINKTNFGSSTTFLCSWYKINWTEISVSIFDKYHSGIFKILLVRFRLQYQKPKNMHESIFYLLPYLFSCLIGATFFLSLVAIVLMWNHQCMQVLPLYLEKNILPHKSRIYWKIVWEVPILSMSKSCNTYNTKLQHVFILLICLVGCTMLLCLLCPVGIPGAASAHWSGFSNCSLQAYFWHFCGTFLWKWVVFAVDLVRNFSSKV
jgi:hypothetical protein